mmetsp:Transcript_16242/g.39177  ORF Transcript_16242/g.39177 Transcript_16242/m.39177 type:complete len:201 (+) Transcript_16242:202-804(+)
MGSPSSRPSGHVVPHPKHLYPLSARNTSISSASRAPPGISVGANSTSRIRTLCSRSNRSAPCSTRKSWPCASTFMKSTVSVSLTTLSSISTLTLTRLLLSVFQGTLKPSCSLPMFCVSLSLKLLSSSHPFAPITTGTFTTKGAVPLKLEAAHGKNLTLPVIPSLKAFASARLIFFALEGVGSNERTRCPVRAIMIALDPS